MGSTVSDALKAAVKVLSDLKDARRAVSKTDIEDAIKTIESSSSRTWGEARFLTQTHNSSELIEIGKARIAFEAGQGGGNYSVIRKLDDFWTDIPPPNAVKLPDLPPPNAVKPKLKVPTWAKATGALFGGYALFEVISVIMGETLSKSLGCKMPWNKQMDTCSSSGPSGGPGGGGDENLTDEEKRMLGTAGILVVLLVFSSVICASFSSSSMMLMMQQK
jgi:hypothetical protein